MNTIIIASIIGALFGAVAFFQEKRKYLEIAKGALIGVSTFSMIGAFIALFVGFQIPRVAFQGAPVQLVALHSSEGTTGAFVWGTGSVGSATTYNVMTRNDDGSFSPASIKANRTMRIIEDKTLTDVGYWTTTYNKLDETSWLNYWAFDDHDLHFAVSEELRVPVGTVRQGFKVD